MWKPATLAALSVLLTVTYVDVPSSQAQGLGYVLAGPVAATGGVVPSGIGTGHVAVGGEVMVRHQFGVGAEIGAMGYAGLFALNGGVHFVQDGGQRLVPYVSGGYFRWSSGEGDFDGVNIAGGMDYWFKQRIGMRMEVRDHIRPDSRGTVQYWSFRLGVVFR